VPGVGVTNTTDESSIEAAMFYKPNHFTGYISSPITPSVTNVASTGPPNNPLPTEQGTTSGLEALVQTVRQNADAVITGPATASDLPPSMSACNPQTIVIQGDPSQPNQGNLSLTGGSFTGYGTLVVTGDFAYTSDFSWYGIILVIGQGKVTVNGGAGTGEIQGAMIVAQTRDASGNMLLGPAPGPATYTVNYPGGVGIFYNTYWVKNVLRPTTYKILSFREIQQ